MLLRCESLEPPVLAVSKPFCGSFGRKIDSDRMALANENFAEAASSILVLRADDCVLRFYTWGNSGIEPY
jgi:hypothetical protein